MDLKRNLVLVIVLTAAILLASCNLPGNPIIPISTQTFEANATLAEEVAQTGTAVSYTHLTLPTKRIV